MAVNANPTVVTQIGNADPNAAPITVNDFITLLNSLISSRIVPDNSFLPYVFGNDPPSVDQQGTVIWLQLDVAGRPIALKFWYTGAGTGGGAWRRVYNGMVGEIRGYSGNPGLSNDQNSDFDVNGHGQVGGTYDGWQLCNGKNGAPDMSNSFLVGANMNNATGTPPGWDGTGWQVYLGGFAEKSGGSPTATLTSANVPLPPLEQTLMNRYNVNGVTIDDAGPIWGVNDTPSHKPIPGGTPPDSNYKYPPAGYPAGRTGDPAPANFWTLPPYIALGWMIFQGY